LWIIFPFNEATLNSFDQDWFRRAAHPAGFAGSAAHPHLVVAAGKSGEGHVTPGGKVYLIDATTWTSERQRDTQIVQVLTNAIAQLQPCFLEQYALLRRFQRRHRQGIFHVRRLLSTNPVRGQRRTQLWRKPGDFSQWHHKRHRLADSIDSGARCCMLQCDTWHRSFIIAASWRAGQSGVASNLLPIVANAKVYVARLQPRRFGTSNTVTFRQSLLRINFRSAPTTQSVSGQGAYNDPGNNFWNLISGTSGVSSAGGTSSSQSTSITMMLNFDSTYGIAQRQLPERDASVSVGSETRSIAQLPALALPQSHGPIHSEQCPAGNYALIFMRETLMGPRLDLHAERHERRRCDGDSRNGQPSLRRRQRRWSKGH